MVICEIHMDWQVNNWRCLQISFHFDICTMASWSYCRVSNKMVSAACSLLQPLVTRRLHPVPQFPQMLDN
jgi:hypothetical protein